MVETAYMIRARASVAAARRFLEDVAAGALRRVALDGALFARAVEYERTYADLGLDVADVSVMALAESQRATILTFDFRDFRATRPLRGWFWRLVIDEERLRRLEGP